MLVYFLYALFAVLQVADLTTTVIAIKKGGGEGNKILASLMNKVGVLPALLVVKTLLVAIVYLVVAYVSHPWAEALISAFIALYVWVVVNNINVIKIQSKKA